MALHEEGPSCSSVVACPVCHSSSLIERNGVVLCPAGDVRLDLRHEGLTLDHVRCAVALTWPCYMLHTLRGGNPLPRAMGHTRGSLAAPITSFAGLLHDVRPSALHMHCHYKSNGRMHDVLHLKLINEGSGSKSLLCYSA